MLTDILADIDLVCLMSVNPGFGGQKFIPFTLNKIRALRSLIHEIGSSALIEIDGGVTLDNAPEIISAGADVLVAGNTVFASVDPKATISKLKHGDELTIRLFVPRYRDARLLHFYPYQIPV
jgi:ribulose-phosphate 3-epimerase